MGFFKRAINKLTSEKVNLRQRKRLIFFIAIITALSMTTATVAWFTVNTFVGVDTLDLHISVAAQLKVSMEDHGKDLSKYVKVITNEMVDEYLAKQGKKLADIVLDPVTTRTGKPLVNKSGTEREPNDISYLEFECYFIATKDMWVHLTSEAAENIEGSEGSNVSTTSTGPKADVVNCARASYETQSDGIAIWEPNRGSPVNGQNTFDVSTPMVYSNNTRLFHLDELTPKKVTVRIWVDGEDPQCDDDVQEANLRMAMCFVGCDDNNKPIA